MEAIKTTTNRIHPLMAAAAASVIVVSLVGTAAITGILPSSNSAPSPQAAALMTSQNPYVPAYAQPAQVQPVGYAQPAQAQPVAYAQPVQGAYAQPAAAMYTQAAPVAAPAPAPVVIKETIIKEVPAKQAVPRPRTVVHHTYARNDYAPAPRPAPQPNYIGIGTGAVIGGLIGNQVGGGNGKKLATVAGIIGGGYLGNQMINTNR
jgi:uncharacterized protein YcfJ